jgi:hypothetical protein
MQWNRSISRVGFEWIQGWQWCSLTRSFATCILIFKIVLYNLSLKFNGIFVSLNNMVIIIPTPLSLTSSSRHLWNLSRERPSPLPWLIAICDGIFLAPLHGSGCNYFPSFSSALGRQDGWIYINDNCTRKTTRFFFCCHCCWLLVPCDLLQCHLFSHFAARERINKRFASEVHTAQCIQSTCTHQHESFEIRHAPLIKTTRN